MTATDRVRETLLAAAAGGRVRLPTLTEVDLLVLGAQFQAAFDLLSVAEWEMASDDERRRMTLASRSVLTRRGLLAGDGVEDTLAPDLTLLLAIRERPLFVATGVEDPADRTRAPRLYGLGDEATGTLTVLCEQRLPQPVPLFGHPVEYALTSPAVAATLMLAWVDDVAAAGDHAVQLVRPGDDGPHGMTWRAERGPRLIRADGTVEPDPAAALTRTMLVAAGVDPGV